MNINHKNCAKIIWEFMLMHQDIKKADVLIVLGNSDIRTADKAANLMLDNIAPIAVVSGGNVNYTKELFNTSEAQRFFNRMKDLGVDVNKIVIENKATNTGDNIRLSIDLLNNLNIKHRNIVLVTKPYMERRALATINAQASGVSAQVTSPSISFNNYADNLQAYEHFINVMVGDLQRLKEYPKKGFLTKQKIPSIVLDAYEELVKAGYNKRLIKN